MSDEQENRLCTVADRISGQAAAHRKLCEERDRLEADLTQARLDLINSDAIRGALVEQAREMAASMSRALAAIESAFHAGYMAGDSAPLHSAEAAYRAWLEELKTR